MRRSGPCLQHPHYLEPPDCLVGVVVYSHVDQNLLAVLVLGLVQRRLELYAAVAEQKGLVDGSVRWLGYRRGRIASGRDGS